MSTLQLNKAEKYMLCSQNDSSYDGVFFMGVHTTGIFCLPSCKARRPLIKNVSFYNQKSEAESAGLRGCRRCRSAFYPHIEPYWFDNLMEFLQENLSNKLTTLDFETITGVDISTIRRYFKEFERTTPAKYHLELRLKEAETLIKNGLEILDVSHKTGFSSISGFTAAYKKRFDDQDLVK